MADSVDRPDCFELESRDGKIIVRGNNSNSIAVGLNYYLKNYCLTTVSWLACNPVEMPDVLPQIEGKIRIKARAQERFFLNYCTFGYTMPWWQWKDWERFIDWMALNGVTMPLAITGQEAVWQRVWTRLGLTDEEIRTYFTGPAHLPWHRMSNLDYWQGPLPQAWIDNQARLQKKIVARERELDMKPVLPAFAGHVPQELKPHYPDATITRVSRWGGFADQYRCSFLDPQDPLFDEIQKAYLEEQTRMFGTDHIYGADPFNEIDAPSWDPRRWPAWPNVSTARSPRPIPKRYGCRWDGSSTQTPRTGPRRTSAPSCAPCPRTGCSCSTTSANSPRSGNRPRSSTDSPTCGATWATSAATRCSRATSGASASASRMPSRTAERTSGDSARRSRVSSQPVHV